MKRFIEKLITELEKEQDNYLHDESDYGEGKYNAYGEQITKIKRLAEEYNNGWIPCSERLPDEDGTYLVQQDDERIDILCYYKGWNCTYMDVDKTRWSNVAERKNIVAWQPLPARYKKGV